MQRVLSAGVVVDGVTVSSIAEGLCCLVGIVKGDTEADIEYIVCFPSPI